MALQERKLLLKLNELMKKQSQPAQTTFSPQQGEVKSTLTYIAPITYPKPGSFTQK